MNARERVMTALEGGCPDRVPIVEPWINQSVLVRLAELLGISSPAGPIDDQALEEERQEMMDVYCQVIEGLGLDASASRFLMGMSAISGNLVRNKYGTTYQLSEHGSPLPVSGPIKKSEDLAGYDMVSKLDPDDFNEVRQVVATCGPDLAHFVVVPCPFKIAWWLLRGGMQQLLMDFVRSPGFVHDLFRVAVEFCKRAIELASEVAPGVTIILEGDIAAERDLIVSPAHYRKFIHPYYEELVTFSHRKGLKIVKHTDGNAWAILDDMVAAGFDAFHPVQPQCMDIKKVKNHLAGRMCIIGNIDCRNLLPYGTEEEVKASVRETIAIAAPGGGYIISSSNSIHPDVNPHNYLAMVEAARRYGSSRWSSRTSKGEPRL